MKTINSKDLKILAELVHNSKATLTNLGDKLGLHPNVVAYRINKLENLGIIRDYTVNLDLEKLGLSRDDLGKVRQDKFLIFHKQLQ